MTDLAKQLGQQIKKYRKLKNLKQMELAELIGVDFKYLSRLETGLSTPSLKTIERLAEIFNIEVSSLFEFEQYADREILIHKIETKINDYSIKQLQTLLSFSKFTDKLI